MSINSGDSLNCSFAQFKKHELGPQFIWDFPWSTQVCIQAKTYSDTQKYLGKCPLASCTSVGCFWHPSPSFWRNPALFLAELSKLTLGGFLAETHPDNFYLRLFELMILEYANLPNLCKCKVLLLQASLSSWVLVSPTSAVKQILSIVQRETTSCSRSWSLCKGFRPWPRWVKDNAEPSAPVIKILKRAFVCIYVSLCGLEETPNTLVHIYNRTQGGLES